MPTQTYKSLGECLIAWLEAHKIKDPIAPIIEEIDERYCETCGGWSTVTISWLDANLERKSQDFSETPGRLMKELAAIQRGEQI